MAVDQYGFLPQQGEKQLERYIVVHYPGAPYEHNSVEPREFLVINLRDCVVERDHRTLGDAREHAQSLNRIKVPF